ncbi:fasciclin domain-containing protein [Fulvimarina sp. MAC3]|uniref:fasciclin domain-containing protein n=1 Tax=Fulvimarina sp. MAC3 TaxID=3148887 RepID=UPI0031FCCBAD
MLKTLIRTTAIASLVIGGAAFAQDANSGSSSSGSSSMSSDTGSNDMPMVGGAPMDPQKTIVENASEASNLTTLVAAVKEAGLVDALSGEGPLTVFAPTNEAFEKLPEGTVEELLKPENKQRLTKILTYHVVPAEATSEAAMQMIQDDGGEHPAKTLEGTDITLSMDGDTIVVTDAEGNKANVVQADVMQSNGVVHVIDTVLMPSE